MCVVCVGVLDVVAAAVVVWNGLVVGCGCDVVVVRVAAGRVVGGVAAVCVVCCCYGDVALAVGVVVVVVVFWFWY